jgi:hypothetical protein
MAAGNSQRGRADDARKDLSPCRPPEQHAPSVVIEDGGIETPPGVLGKGLEGGKSTDKLQRFRLASSTPLVPGSGAETHRYVVRHATITPHIA